LTLSYDGTGFRGWAVQRDRSIRTVQGVLTDVIAAVIREPVKLIVAGRTDAGVHARGQVASFATASSTSCDRVRDAINGRLGPEVVALDVRDASSGFDARFSASAREYRYRVDVNPIPDPFTARFTWHHPCEPDLRSMRAAAVHLVGERDFASFCRHPGAGRSTIRRLQRVTVTRSGDRLEIGFRANAFLHQMVRSLTGILIAVGEGSVGPDEIPSILAARDRARARQLAPPQGLTLERVIYGPRGVPGP
jgi:tRNA pseudouridine38-40 synthase